MQDQNNNNTSNVPPTSSPLPPQPSIVSTLSPTPSQAQTSGSSVATAQLPSSVNRKNLSAIATPAILCIVGAVILALLGSLFSQSSYIPTNANTQQIALNQRRQSNNSTADSGEGTVLQPVNILPDRPTENAQNVADVARLVDAIKRYQADNHSRIPRDGPTRVIGHSAAEKTTNTDNPEKTWLYLYDQYLMTDSDFVSPDGRPYSLNILECAPNKQPVKDGNECVNQGILATETFFGQDHVIDVVTNAKCNDAGNFAIAKPDDDFDVAVLYKTIDNNIICESN